MDTAKAPRCTPVVAQKSNALASDNSKSHAPEDLENLVYLRVSREQGIAAHDHLSEDASHRPHIDCSRVMA